MNVLAIETTAGACSVALAGEHGLAERFEPMLRGQAERLLPLTEAVLAEAGVGFAALDLVAVATGPGTFTGLRVGLAAARGLALAAARPCLGVTSFEAVLEAERAAAQSAWGRGEAVLVVLDSRRREVFAQAFLAPDGAPAPAVVARPEQLAEQFGAAGAGSLGLVVGSAATIVGASFGRNSGEFRPLVMESQPRAAAVARVALRRWRNGERPTRPPDPLYLRAPEIGGGTPAP